ncbi:hypothetical protein [Brevundimonas vesicularis]|uniref:hypothetical protein n=1 Tax=Brevundimonas vesicularis TaxID=41276 RepID=UPI0038D4B232
MLDPIQTLRAEGAVISQAPWSFAICVTAVSALIFLLIRALKAQQISDLESRLTLRNDEIEDYRRKLDGASPDEARARIDAIEKALREEIQNIDKRYSKLAPRGLSAEQRNTIIQLLGNDGGTLSIMKDAAVADGQQYAQQLAEMFHIAGWRVSSGVVLGISNPPKTGLAVSVSNTESPNKNEHRIIDAFTAAHVPFDLREGSLGLLVTAPPSVL